MMLLFTASAVKAAILTLLISASPQASAMYSKTSSVLQLNSKTYDTLIAHSNYTSIVEFYAPWCGHCKNLAPAYNAAATNLAGIAKVAAVNCDEESNKPFCGRMGVQGFPTLKIVRPSKDPKRAGKPNVEDYQGERTAKGIVDAVVKAMPNHVHKPRDGTLDAWVEEAKTKDGVKAVLFTEKATTAGMTKALAIDFLGSIAFTQVRKTAEGEAAAKNLGVASFPTLVVFPGGNADAVKYDGEMKKPAILKFLSTFATPNADARGEAAPSSQKSKQPTPPNKQSKKDTKSSATEAEASTSPSSSAASSPSPADQVTTLDSLAALHATCLSPTTKTCVLFFAASSSLSLPRLEAVASRRKNSFPFFQITPTNPAFKDFPRKLSLEAPSEDSDATPLLIAVNGKKGWFSVYESASTKAEDGDKGLDQSTVGSWIDDIRMGEVKRSKLPNGLLEPLDKDTENDQKKEKDTKAEEAHNEL